VNGTHVGGGSYSVASGATLGGNGTIDLSAVNGNVTVSSGGKLSPGSASNIVGTLTLALGGGALELSAAAGNAGALRFDLAAPGASDNLTLTSGTANLGSGLLNFASFTFNNLAAVPGTYVLLHSANGITGTLGTGLTGTVGALAATLSLSGNDVILTLAPPSVTLAAPKLVGNQVILSFPTLTGQTYQVEYTTNLSTPTVWTPLGVAVAGTADAVSVTNDITGGQNFFRLRIQ